MTRKLSHITWTILLLFGTLPAFSQQPYAKASVDKNQILIGEPVQLVLEANVPPNSAATWFVLDSIPHFTFIDKGKIDSSITAGGKSYRQQLSITSFDSGSRVIPPLILLVDNKKFFTDSILIEVSFTKMDPQQDYHDIKDIIDIANPYAAYIAWIVLGITVVCAALLVYFIQKRPAAVVPGAERVISRLSPYEEAMQSLGALWKQNLPEAGQVKLFYTRLNDILRQFLLRKLQMASMEKTNEEIILQLRQLDISREQFAAMVEALRMSDFVKFAKYTPGTHDNDRNFAVIESAVRMLNEIYK